MGLSDEPSLAGDICAQTDSAIVMNGLCEPNDSRNNVLTSVTLSDQDTLNSLYGDARTNSAKATPNLQ
jgi:hypothetical protein